jgi:DNA repair protein RadC
MALKAADPTRYTLHVVTFSVVREPDSSGTRVPSRSRAKLNDPAAVAQLGRQIIADDAREHFWTLMLDSQNGLVAAHEVSTGTLSASLVHPREVFGPALRVLGVASVVLIHNHPSGDATPSREDLSLTRQLVNAGRLLDIRVHDHVVIGNGTDAYVSLAQRGAV